MNIFKTIHILVVLIFTAQPIFAQGMSTSVATPPTLAVNSVLKGLLISPFNPYELRFLYQGPDEKLADHVDYFFTALTIPNDEIWVNLSPIEKDRLSTPELIKTKLGQELLEQDYRLKKLATNLLNPNSDIGQKFWNSINISNSTNNQLHLISKIWIVPDYAEILPTPEGVLINETRLKIKLNQDMQLTHHLNEQHSQQLEATYHQYIIPEIEHQINNAPEFAELRKIYHGIILAKWFKETIQQHSLNQSFSDHNHIEGQIISEQNHHEVYNQYINEFKNGAFYHYKDEFNTELQQIIPRKYFSGGYINQFSTSFTRAANPLAIPKSFNVATITIDNPNPDESALANEESTGMQLYHKQVSNFYFKYFESFEKFRTRYQQMLEILSFSPETPESFAEKTQKEQKLLLLQLFLPIAQLMPEYENLADFITIETESQFTFFGHLLSNPRISSKELTEEELRTIYTKLKDYLTHAFVISEVGIISNKMAAKLKTTTFHEKLENLLRGRTIKPKDWRDLNATMIATMNEVISKTFHAVKLHRKDPNFKKIDLAPYLNEFFSHYFDIPEFFLAPVYLERVSNRLFLFGIEIGTIGVGDKRAISIHLDEIKTGVVRKIIEYSYLVWMNKRPSMILNPSDELKSHLAAALIRDFLSFEDNLNRISIPPKELYETMVSIFTSMPGSDRLSVPFSEDDFAQPFNNPALLYMLEQFSIEYDPKINSYQYNMNTLGWGIIPGGTNSFAEVAPGNSDFSMLSHTPLLPGVQQELIYDTVGGISFKEDTLTLTILNTDNDHFRKFIFPEISQIQSLRYSITDQTIIATDELISSITP